ncbi:hypothetical protein LCGC14_2258590 [marine sediment metagenome]|uniref:Uncharacterized protein n=1 Tax=marine sediment metagenome TaxID=412755 RepID=A0A0F9FVE1_9ZZZZ
MKDGKYSCYFAHPYESRFSPEETAILNELIDRRVEIINPFDVEDSTMFKKYGIESYYPDPPYKLGREIWQKDLKYVAECDMILVYVPDGTRLSGGCGIEMFHAFQLHKFIQIISKDKHPAFAYVLTKGNQMYDSIQNWIHNKMLVWD